MTNETATTKTAEPVKTELEPARKQPNREDENKISCSYGLWITSICWGGRIAC